MTPPHAARLHIIGDRQDEVRGDQRTEAWQDDAEDHNLRDGSQEQDFDERDDDKADRRFMTASANRTRSSL